MYDPQLGRYHVIDPLTEWHFNYNPYHYCFNNPINFIDPFGLDTTYILPEPIDPVYITYEPEPGLLKKILQFIGKLLESGEDIVTGNPEPYKETIVEDGVDMEWYKSEESYGNQNVVTRDNPNYDKIFRDRNRSYKNDNSKTSNTQKQIPDKEIVNNNTGTAQKTNAHGKSIDDKGQPSGKYSNWKKRDALVGSAYEDQTGDSILLISPDGDSSLYVPYTRKKTRQPVSLNQKK